MMKMAMIPTRKFISLFIISLFINSCLDKSNYLLHHPNGSIKVSGSFINNKAHGYWQGFYENGNPKSFGLYYNGSLIGRWRWYYEDDTLLKDTIYTSRLLDE